MMEGWHRWCMNDIVGWMDTWTLCMYVHECMYGWMITVKFECVQAKIWAVCVRVNESLSVSASVSASVFVQWVGQYGRSRRTDRQACGTMPFHWGFPPNIMGKYCWIGQIWKLRRAYKYTSRSFFATILSHKPRVSSRPMATKYAMKKEINS